MNVPTSGPVSGRILALDVGNRRIGLACSDPTGFLATPIGTYTRTDEARDVDHILRLAREHEAATVVVGLPVNMNGSEGSQAEMTRGFAEALTRQELVVELWDERLTTVEATRMLLEQGVKPKDVPSHVDEAAAVLILESYLLSRGPRAGTANS